MAFTTSFVTDSVMGKYRLRVYDVTPDATTGSFDTGMKRVTWALVSPKSMVTMSGNSSPGPHWAENAHAEGTAAAGYIALTGTVADDVIRVVAFGPS